jgi:hypothetical protein
MRAATTTLLTILITPFTFIGMVVVSFFASFPLAGITAHRHAIRIAPKLLWFLSGKKKVVA